MMIKDKADTTSLSAGMENWKLKLIICSDKRQWADEDLLTNWSGNWNITKKFWGKERRGGNIWQSLLALNRTKKAWPTDVVLLTYLTDKLKHKSHILIYWGILGFMSRLDHVLLLIMNNTNITSPLSLSLSLYQYKNLYLIIFKATHLEKFAITPISVILTWYLPTFRLS